jgi:hypothetical protein
MGVDASDKATAEPNGPRMELAAYVSDPSMRTLRWSFVGGRGYILTSVSGRFALASRRVIGTEVS